MEIAKFVLTAVGIFLSVLALSFTVFTHWRKKADEKIANLKGETREGLKSEGELRQKDMLRLEKRIDNLESTLVQSMLKQAAKRSKKKRNNGIIIYQIKI